ncbi:MAG TPA: hypothetical protein VMM12_09185 [Longimicrobiales bacterium]|nr:hypothetical protein [Longimicrobiales bacterium]
MLQRNRLVLIGLLAALAASACASAGGTARPRTDVITAEEIEATRVSNLYELVQRLRPRWLDLRSSQSFTSDTQIVVYQGQSYLGGVEMLRQFGRESAHRLIYLDGPTASATLPGLGTRQVEAAIVINPVN